MFEHSPKLEVLFWEVVKNFEGWVLAGGLRPPEA